MIEFFRSHRFVRGSISIMLALILLPLYTFIAVVMESARYRSAQEQLGELTFLGEMAILADYVDFLASDYDIYAYKSDGIKDSFEKYMNKTASAGGVDTRKLNKLFGIDIEKCDIKYMYSAADPTILANQIRQNGRYALPFKALNEFVLADIFKKLEKCLEGVNKKLSIVKAGAESLEDSTDVIKQCKLMDTALTKLEGKLNEIQSVQGQLIDKKNNVTNWDVINNENFEKLYDKMQGNDPDTYVWETNRDEALTLYNTYKSLKDDASNYFDLTSTERQEFKIEINSDTAAFLGVENDKFDDENKVLCSYVISKLANKSKMNGIDNIQQYNSAMSAANSDYQEYDALCTLYTDSEPLFDFINEYKKEDGYYKKVGELKEIYKEYITAVKNMYGSFSGMIQSYDTASATMSSLEFDKTIDDLNEKGTTARKERAKYENSSEELDTEAKNELKKNMDEAAKKRREAYQTAREKRDFANIGTNLLNKFLDEIREDMLDAWLSTLNDKYDDSGLSYTEKGMPNFNKISSFEDFKKAVNYLKGYDFSAELITKFDFISANGGTPFDAGIYSGSINNYILQEYDKDQITDTEYLTEQSLEIIYGVFLSPSENSNLKYLDSDHLWFSFNNNKSYYFSRQTIIMLFGFMVGSLALTPDSGASQFLDAIKRIVELLGNLYPDDGNLNNHIGSKHNLKTLSSETCTFPSEGPLYSNTSFDAAEDPAEIEKQIRAASGQYASAVIKNKQNFPLDGYYLYTDSQQTTYDDIFGGRQPGDSIRNLVQGSSGIIEKTIDFIDSISKFNLIRAIKAVTGFCQAITKLITGIIEFIIDISRIIYAVIDALANSNTKILQYMLDQLFVGYYAAGSFTSRATADGCDGDYNSPFVKHLCNVDCRDDKIIFDGAELEYLLNGSPCEITNQHTAFYAIMMIRFLLNFSLVASDEKVQTLADVPYVGPVLVVVTVLTEANLDVMLLLSGVSVPLIKTKVSLTNIEGFFNDLKRAIDNTNNKKLEYKMTGTGDEKRRKYKNNNKTVSEMIDKSISDELIGKDGILPMTYDWYINILLFLYPEKLKLGRICDLIQMHGMVEEGKKFRLEDCYTYVYADVRADYSPLLPLLSGNMDSDPFPDLRTVQMNGY